MHLGCVDFQSGKTEQQEREAHEEVTEVGVLFRVYECDRQHNRRIDDESQIERTTAQDHNPSGKSRTDVGTHDDRDGLRQREDTGRHEADGHDGCSRG